MNPPERENPLRPPLWDFRENQEKGGKTAIFRPFGRILPEKALFFK